MDILNRFIEKDLETMLFENIDKLKERGFTNLYRNNKRQFKLFLGGIIDVFSYEVNDDNLLIKIIELKRGEIDPSAIIQILQYWGEVQLLTTKNFKTVEIELILVGKNLSESSQTIAYALDNLRIYEYSMGFNGLTFNKLDTGNETKNLEKPWTEKFETGIRFCDNLRNTMEDR